MESTRAPDLRINGERLKTLDIHDVCRHLGYWGTGNGDMRGTTEVVRENANILLEAIEELRKRTTAGAATFLVRVKAHRGEPANEEADIQADKAISGKDIPTEWHDRSNRAVFTWQEPRRKRGTVSYADRKSTWNSGVRKAIRRGSEEQEVRKHWDRVTGA